MELAVIIVNWNGKKLLSDCFNSLQKQTYKNFRIIFVDNGSTDDSVAFVEKNYPLTEIIRLGKNTGFAYANNLGIKKSFGDVGTRYVVTLNNDTKADEKYLEELVACAKRHPEAASIQPKVLNFFDQNIIDSAGILIYLDASAINRGQKEANIEKYAVESEIFGASASAALYARDALEKTKLPGEYYFDSDYFAYYEDVDLAWRMRLAGFPSWYCPTAKILHVHSATGKNYSPFKSFHIARNQYYNILKNLPFCFMLRALFFMPIRYLFFLLSIIMKKGPAARLSENKEKESVVKIILRAWLQVLKNIPILIKKRRYIQKNRIAKNSDVRRWMKEYRADFKKMVLS